MLDILCITELWSTIVPAWLSAIGTVGAVLYALFGKTISQWFYRPQIKVSIKDKTPYVEVLELNQSSSVVDKEIRIRISVENKGTYTASHSIVVIDQYYKWRQGGDTYLNVELTPIQIRDYQNKTQEYIAPNLIYYFDIASIRKSDEIVKSDSGSKSHQFYKLFIIGNKKPIKLGKGTFIIPIKISSPKMKTHTSYLRIYWNNDEFSMDNQFFAVAMIEEKEFCSLNIG